MQACVLLAVSWLHVPAARLTTGTDSANAVADTASAARMARVTGATAGVAWLRFLRGPTFWADPFIVPLGASGVAAGWFAWRSGAPAHAGAPDRGYLVQLTLTADQAVATAVASAEVAPYRSFAALIVPARAPA